ncbi:MAG TPA: hypothetical protein VET85_04200 [Stellaceae bacterium]|nr:hypothetical protein [Stellaceae bacterium]
MSATVSAATMRWEESRRKPVPAPMSELLHALERLRGEAAVLAEEAYHAIQHHSYAPYWKFRDKLEEHAALVEVIRGRLPRLKEAKVIAEHVNREEHEILILSTQSCLKFSFALSANPLLPIGARETFIHEVDALTQARKTLSETPPEQMPAGLLDELDTTLMILEEIIAKAPSLTEFAADRRRAAEAQEQSETESPAPTEAPVAA